MLIAPLACAAVDAGYEAAKRPSGQSNPTCPTNPNLADSWGFTISTCECVSYAAYRLNLNNVRRNNVLFGNDAWGTHFGYAYQWNGAAIATGIREDQYPAVGSVAHWTKKQANGRGFDPNGHVAYVQHIFTHPNDGRITSIGIMEYNYSDHRYTYRKLAHGRGNYPTSFLHFEEKGTDADKTNATCVTGLASSPSGANAGAFCWKHQSNTNASCGSATSTTTAPVRATM